MDKAFCLRGYGMESQEEPLSCSCLWFSSDSTVKQWVNVVVIAAAFCGLNRGPRESERGLIWVERLTLFWQWVRNNVHFKEGKREAWDCYYLTAEVPKHNFGIRDFNTTNVKANSGDDSIMRKTFRDWVDRLQLLQKRLTTIQIKKLKRWTVSSDGSYKRRVPSCQLCRYREWGHGTQSCWTCNSTVHASVKTSLPFLQP